MIASLVEELVAILREDPGAIERNGAPVSGEAELRDAVIEHVDRTRQRLEEMKLLRLG